MRSATAFEAVKAVTHPLRHWWLDVTVENPQNVPAFGGAIIAANHLSFIDSMLLMHSLGRPVSFLGKVEYMDSLVTRTVFPAVGMIPIDRSGSGLASTMREVRARLDDGELVGIFPEGTRSRDGKLHPGHSGVAHLSLLTGSPIIPVGLIGTDEVMPIGSKNVRRGPVTIRVGRMIGPRPEAGRRPTMKQRLALTEDVMAEIARLSEQRAPVIPEPIAVT